MEIKINGTIRIEENCAAPADTGNTQETTPPSDQVWNPYYTFTGTDLDFLAFVEDKRKIAYAASFGVSSLPGEKVPQYKEYLCDFSKISTREDAGADIVFSLIDFNEDGVGLVDMACFPGSSGSPIFILNEGGYKDKKGNLNWGQSRVFFMGILFAGPQYNATGDIVVKTIPTSQQMVQSQTRMMVNLGYYIKSAELNEFKQLIETARKQGNGV